MLKLATHLHYEHPLSLIRGSAPTRCGRRLILVEVSQAGDFSIFLACKNPVSMTFGPFVVRLSPHRAD